MNLEIQKVALPFDNKPRTIRIYLPKELKQKHYPVLYMHDGQNLFDPSTAAFGKVWDIANTLESLETQKQFSGIIVVGIDNDPEGINRLEEYSPWDNDQFNDMISWVPVSQVRGRGEDYIQFIIHKVKPYIDEHYPTRPDTEHTAIAGSSMGGLISLYAIFQYPQIFSNAGVFSPALWFAKEELFQFIKKKKLPKKLKLYLDVGTEETNDEKKPDFPQVYINDTLELFERLTEMGMDKKRLKLVVEAGADHSEISWARRFPGFIHWMY